MMPVGISHAEIKDEWRDLTDLNEIDIHFGRFMQGLAREGFSEVGLAAALVSRGRHEGHICLDLARVGGTSLTSGQGNAAVRLPDPVTWSKHLLASGVVGRPGEVTPLILDARSRLYLYRYWAYQDTLAQAIGERITAEIPVDLPLLTQGLERFFPGEGPDGQRAAAYAALTSPFSVISGGPGTGKTTTVAKILALFLEQPGLRGPCVALAAPTGKAAVRMADAIRYSKAGLPCTQSLKDRIPDIASTLHRLLGTIPGSPYFRHHQNNPLPVDLLVVDEASMIDLALMAKLTQALLPRARILLLGDKDQLASVEAGAVFADICDAASASVGREALPGGWFTQLTRNYRFDEQSGIGTLSRAVRAGDQTRVSRIIDKGGYDDITFQPVTPPEALLQLPPPLITAQFGAYLKQLHQNPLAQFDRFRILCALREGPFGVVAVNALVEQVLSRAGLISPGRPWYPGRPVMITKNDYHLRLFNGDVGIIVPDPRGREGLRAVFPGEGGDERHIHPLRLPPHETVFAMSVHKSQGSEFDRVLLVLPNQDSPVLSRELIYTAVTRVRHHLDIIGNKTVFLNALSRRVERNSGLKDALYGV